MSGRVEKALSSEITAARSRAFDLSSEAALVVDDQRRAVDANRAAETLLGLARESLVSRPLVELVPGLDVASLWRDLLAREEAPSVFVLAREDGSRRVIEVRAHANVAPGQHLLLLREGVAPEASDALKHVTDLLGSALARLEGERATLNQLVEHLPVPTIVYAAPDFHIEMVNSAYRQIVKDRELVGKLVPDALPDVPTDSTLAHLREVSRSKEPRTRREHAVRLTNENGDVEERYYTSTFQPLCDETGEVRRIVAVNFDVTQEVRARKAIARAAERLRVVLDELPLGVNVRDGRSGAIVLSNRASEEILGVDVRSLVDPASLATPPEGSGAGPYEPQFRRVMTTNEPVRAELVRVRNARTGARVMLRSSAVPISDGDVPLVISVFQDVTEEHRLEAERELTLRFAEQFVGILGHDLRNPLNAIAMGTTLMRQSGNGGTKTLERIDRSVRRMTRMVDQLLDLTRARLAGGIPVDRRPTDLVRVVASAVEELTVAHPSSVVQCRAPDQLLGVWDGDRLAQVVSNLVGNAIAYGAATRPVTVVLTEGPDTATLSVHSEGAPIPEAFLPVLFDPFRRGSGQDSTKASGLGLGLFISREIVVAQGGDIRVSSNAADGTTFVVTLPRVSGDAAPAE